MAAKLFAAVCLLIFSSAAVHSQTGQTSLATVSGRITAQGKGVPDALVLIWKQPVQEPYDESTLRGVTDSQGKYQIKNVPPGNYYASASAPGYFFVEDGKPSLRLKPLVVVEGDALNNVDFQLLKGGVITGKVVSPDDKPIPEIPVTVIPEIPERQAPGPRQAMKRPNSTRTDDRGIYRIYGITP